MLPLKMSRCLANVVHQTVWFCLWFCISVPGRCSSQRSQYEFYIVLFIFRPWFSHSSANSCSICCRSCGIVAHVSMSSAKRIWLRYSPEYAFECCREQRGRYGSYLSYSFPDFNYCCFLSSSGCWCRFT